MCLDARTGKRQWHFQTVHHGVRDYDLAAAPNLVSIDLNAGAIVWKIPFGEGSKEIREHPLLSGVDLPDRLGTMANPGPIVTGGGIVFIGGDPCLYAFDKVTGAEIWRGATPFPTAANPMAYRTRSGRQFVVIATGSGPDAAPVALARPGQLGWSV